MGKLDDILDRTRSLSDILDSHRGPKPKPKFRDNFAVRLFRVIIGEPERVPLEEGGSKPSKISFPTGSEDFDFASGIIKEFYSENKFLSKNTQVYNTSLIERNNRDKYIRRKIDGQKFLTENYSLKKFPLETLQKLGKKIDAAKLAEKSI
jgi:hypothetical protein